MLSVRYLVVIHYDPLIEVSLAAVDMAIGLLIYVVMAGLFAVEDWADRFIERTTRTAPNA